ncbi:hypothetical protein CAPTEDRAFT_141899 [Capitella teleta]|uniref:Metalloendopeptidase n=1 Tax=Capitella teleta TaxID=283909 RepID=R7UVB9_CAPTE|nr:hypothetical protein CAPTEDRAFT_141899 [Capitella teleta]|eukprot:ELU07351.1 hypothetical protein CAPTEDRAFT_141899 [Capitella teleta]
MVTNRKRKKRNAVSIEAYLWPGGVVPYVFATGYSKRLDARSMDVIMEETCIQYRPKEADDENWMQIGEESPGCFAMIGRGNTETTVNLAADCTNAMGRVQHELLHALGFWHEHSRSDRDDYVTVVWENIQEDSADNFEKRTSNIDNQNIGYDYGSVMHYAEDFFTKVEGEPTLVTSRPEGAAIGQRVLMSPSDYAGVNIRYGCPSMNR